MVKKQENGKTEKVETILVAAQKRFAHFGFVKTSMIEIAQDVGMSKASLYYYFTDKETIFQEVIKKEQHQFVSQIEKIMLQDVSASDLLIKYVKKRLVYFQEFLNLSKLNSDTIKSVKPIFSSLFRQFKEEEATLIKNIIKKGIKDGDFDKVNADEHADLFISLVQSLRSYMIVNRGLENLTKEDFQQLEKQLVSVAKIFSKGMRK